MTHRRACGRINHSIVIWVGETLFIEVGILSRETFSCVRSAKVIVVEALASVRCSKFHTQAFAVGTILRGRCIVVQCLLDHLGLGTELLPLGGWEIESVETLALPHMSSKKFLVILVVLVG